MKRKWVKKVYVIALLLGSATVLFLMLSLNYNQETPIQNEANEDIESANEILIEDSLEKNEFYLPEVPKGIMFCNEEIPLNISDVHEMLDNEMIVNNYWHSQTFRLLKRSNRFFPEIEPILKEYGVPDDMKYLLLAESGLRNVTSPAGAKGYWQFMKNTALEYDLEISKDVDERYHLEKATIAACKYLKKAHKRFDSWVLAAAAYNMGSGGLSNQIKKQKTNNYFRLHLNSETSRYVYRILAIKSIMESPENYGFKFGEKDLYQPYSYETFLVDTTIHNLIDFASAINANYKMLKKANPWLISNKLSNEKKKVYTLKIIKE